MTRKRLERVRRRYNANRRFIAAENGWSSPRWDQVFACFWDDNPYDFSDRYNSPEARLRAFARLVIRTAKYCRAVS